MNLVQLPAFALSVIVLWWSPTIGSLVFAVRCFQLFGPRNDAFTWSRFLVSFFRIKVLKFGTNVPCQEKCLFLSNHRSWADFFLDAYLSEGRAMLLSRLMVSIAFPMIVSSVAILKGILLFKRGKVNDKEAFNSFLDEKIAASPQASLLVFPEGHRNTKQEPLPLKRGMLHYAYGRKLPVQVVMSTNKERVISEKHMTVGFGTTVVTGYSDIVRAADFEDFQQFYAKVESTWLDMWNKVYSANPAELPELQPNPPLYNYPMSMRLLHLAKELLGIYLLLRTLLFWVGLMGLAFAAKYAGLLLGKGGSSKAHSSKSGGVVANVTESKQE